MTTKAEAVVINDGAARVASLASGSVSKTSAFKALNRLKLIDISNNLGDAKSLICHPYTTTHQRLTAEQKAEVGITEGFVRLSVGLENSDDLIADLGQTLQS